MLPPFQVDGKECDGQERCPSGFFCAPLPGTPRGVCSATEPSCPGASLGAACEVGEGACQRAGTLICTLEGAACSELEGSPTAESCNGVDDDCDGEVDDASGCLYSLAGAGPPGFVDGPSDQARFGGPGFINVAANGDLLVADTYAHAVRRVDASGSVTTVAGVGRCGFQDGPGAQAAFCLPGEVVEAADGTLYVSDSGNSRLRAISTAGVVTTVAGTGVPGNSSGAALSAQLNYPLGLHAMADGSVVIADRDAHLLRRFTPGQVDTLTVEAGIGLPGVDEGTRLAMRLNSPVDVLSTGGDGLYVVERHQVRQLPSGGVSSRISGSIGAGFGDNVFSFEVRFHQPMQLSLVPGGGQLLVADSMNNRLRGIDLGNGATGTLLGGASGFRNGAIGATQLRQPFGVASVGANSWAFLDGNARLRKVTGDLATNTTVDFAGGLWQRQTQDGAAARLSGPRGLIRTPAGELWWVEPTPELVRRLRADGTVETVAGLAGTPGSGGYVNGAFASARVSGPMSLASGPDGQVYLVERWNHAVRRFDPASGQVSTLAGPPTASAGLVNGTLTEARFSQPTAIAIVAGDLFVFDAGNRVIRRIEPGANRVSTFAGTEGSAGTDDGAVGVGRLANVTALSADGLGGLWALEDGRRLRRIASDGTLSTPLPLLSFTAEVLYTEAPGVLLLAGGERLVEVDAVTGAETQLLPAADNRAPVGFVDGSVHTAASFQISGLAGSPQALYLVDGQANRVRRLWR